MLDDPNRPRLSLPMPSSNYSDASTPSASLVSSLDSVNSIPLPLSPKDGLLDIGAQLPQRKFPPDDSITRPIIERMTGLSQSRRASFSPPPSSLYKPSNNDVRVKANSLHPQQLYHPYSPRSGPIPPGLHYAAQCLGIMSFTNLTLDQVEEQKDAFLDALSAMPDTILMRALDAKRAEHDCVALRLALTIAEIKSSEARMSLLSAVSEQHDGDATISRAYMHALNQALGHRGLAEVKANKQYYEKERAAQLAALAITQADMSSIFAVIGPGGSRWLGDDSGDSMLASDEDDGFVGEHESDE